MLSSSLSNNAQGMEGANPLDLVPSFSVSNAAFAKIRDIISSQYLNASSGNSSSSPEKSNHDVAENIHDILYFRIMIQAGGCSGFRYAFSIVDSCDDSDIALSNPETGEKMVLIDSSSYDILKGAQLDYEESIAGSGFVVRNQKKSGGCGCGKSFTL